MLASALATTQRVSKFYERPTLYTDDMGAEVFEYLGIDADIQVTHNEIFDTVPESIWAYPKLVTYSMQTEPYLHYDLDFIIKKPFPRKWFNADVGVQWFEDATADIDSMKYVYNFNKYHHHYRNADELLYDPNHARAFCTGVLYMNNMELNKEYCDTVLKFIADNIDVFNTENELHSCVLEQQVLSDKVDKYSMRATALKEWVPRAVPETKHFVHFMGSTWKKSTDYEYVNNARIKYFGSFIDDKVRKLAAHIDHLKQE